MVLETGCKVKKYCEMNITEKITHQNRIYDGLVHRFSTFKMLWPFNTAPHVVVTPPHHKIISAATS